MLDFPGFKVGDLVRLRHSDETLYLVLKINYENRIFVFLDLRSGIFSCEYFRYVQDFIVISECEETSEKLT